MRLRNHWLFYLLQRICYEKSWSKCEGDAWEAGHLIKVPPTDQVHNNKDLGESQKRKEPRGKEIAFKMLFLIMKYLEPRKSQRRLKTMSYGSTNEIITVLKWCHTCWTIHLGRLKARGRRTEVGNKTENSTDVKCPSSFSISHFFCTSSYSLHLGMYYGQECLIGHDNILWVGDMAEQLRAFDVLAEDQGFAPRIHKVVHTQL